MQVHDFTMFLQYCTIKYCHNVCYRSDDYGTVQLSQVTQVEEPGSVPRLTIYSMSGDLRKTGQALLLAQSRLITACLLLAHGLAHQLHGLPHLLVQVAPSPAFHPTCHPVAEQDTIITRTREGAEMNIISVSFCDLSIPRI